MDSPSVLGDLGRFLHVGGNFAGCRRQSKWPEQSGPVGHRPDRAGCTSHPVAGHQREPQARDSGCRRTRGHGRGGRGRDPCRNRGRGHFRHLAPPTRRAPPSWASTSHGSGERRRRQLGPGQRTLESDHHRPAFQGAGHRGAEGHQRRHPGNLWHLGARRPGRRLGGDCVTGYDRLGCSGTLGVGAADPDARWRPSARGRGGGRLRRYEPPERRLATGHPSHRHARPDGELLVSPDRYPGDSRTLRCS